MIFFMKQKTFNAKLKAAEIKGAKKEREHTKPLISKLLARGHNIAMKEIIKNFK